MKLFTKSDEKKLQLQWGLGSDISSQMVFVKIFDPSGRFYYYIVNQNPKNTDEIYGIIKTPYDVEVGMLSKKVLETLRLKPFGSMLERDLYFEPERASTIFRGLMNNQSFAKGGEVMVDIVNEGEVYDKEKYKAIFGNYDNDSLANIDDPNPTLKGDKNSVEQVQLNEVFEKLLIAKNNLDNKMYRLVEDLKNISPKGAKIYARTKTPYSILNKLINKKMLNTEKAKDGEIKGLTDMIGTTIVVYNFRQLQNLKKKILNGALGEIIEFVDYYTSPKAGYMAYHFIINFEGYPSEVQIKTKRQKALNEASHSPYKYENLDGKKLLFYSSLMKKADLGDEESILEADAILKNPSALEYDLYADKSKIKNIE